MPLLRKKTHSAQISYELTEAQELLNLPSLLFRQLHRTPPPLSFWPRLYIPHSRFILCSVSSAFPPQPSVLLLSSLSAPLFLGDASRNVLSLLTQPARGALPGESTQQFHSTLACLSIRVTAGATLPRLPTRPPIQQFKNSKSRHLPLLSEDLKGIRSLLGRDVANVDEFAIGMGILRRILLHKALPESTPALIESVYFEPNC